MNGQLPFEGDTFIPIEILKLKKKFKLHSVIETGSQYGATLQWFKENFINHSGCEPNEEFYQIAKAKGVNVYKMYSIAFLQRFEGNLKTLIYIDSHWHDTPCPLKDELKLIAKLNINPVICIHDFKVPNKDFGFDEYDYALEFSEIEPLLPAIYPDGYEYHYNTEANGANRGIIFIYPKK